MGGEPKLKMIIKKSKKGKKRYVSPEMKEFKVAHQSLLVEDSYNNGFINMKDETKTYLA